jgi:hypothetical protein
MEAVFTPDVRRNKELVGQMETMGIYADCQSVAGPILLNNPDMAPIVAAITQHFEGFVVPMANVVFCGDQRHHSRHIKDVCRQFLAEHYAGKGTVEELISRLGFKEFNIQLSHVIKAFGQTPAGGRASKDSEEYCHIVKSSYMARMVAVFAGDHEDHECLAAKAGRRIGWQSAILSNLTTLSVVGFRNKIDIYTFSVQTDGTIPGRFNRAAQHNGNAIAPDIFQLPTGN